MREQQSVRPAPPRRMSAKQMNSSLLSGIFNGCNGTRSRPTAATRSGCGILAWMFTFRTRRRRWWLGAITTALVVSLAALLLRPMLEHEVRGRTEAAAGRHGA